MRDSSEGTAEPGARARRPPGFFRGLLIWSYERGTLQYDVICGLILAFIFFVPRSCFVPHKPASAQEAGRPSAAAPLPTAQPTR